MYVIIKLVYMLYTLVITALIEKVTERRCLKRSQRYDKLQMCVRHIKVRTMP